jgi:hypothetical protein
LLFPGNLSIIPFVDLFQGGVRFPTGGDQQALSVREPQGRTGANPVPTVQSGWKKRFFLLFALLSAAAFFIPDRFHT